MTAWPLESLTVVPEKIGYFLAEPEFQSAWADVDASWGDEAGELLHTTTFLMFLPEAVVEHGVGSLVSGAEALGFHPLCAVRVQLHNDQIVPSWRYHLNNATPARIRLSEQILTATPSMLVVFRAADPDPDGLPASVRLAELKGPADPARRHPWQLRSIPRFQDAVIAYIHSPDEPLDVVREFGMFLDPVARRALLEEIRGAGALPAEARRRGVGDKVRALEAEHRYRRLDFDHCLRRLSEHLAHHPGHEMLRKQLDAMAAGDRGHADDVARRLVDAEVGDDFWDRAVVAAPLLKTVVPGVDTMLPSCNADDWRSAMVSRPDPRR